MHEQTSNNSKILTRNDSKIVWLSEGEEVCDAEEVGRCRCLGALVIAVTVVGFAAVPSLAIQPIAADSLCPAAGCASGTCHGFDAVPEPDGVHEMMCPEAGCASAECHGWDSLIGRYHQASDMSLNVWILMPVALVLGRWLLVRRMGRGSRRTAGEEEACCEA